MIHTRILICLLVLLTGFTADEMTETEKIGEKLVFKLTTEDFDSVTELGDKHTWIIMFYVPWCPHCTRLMPLLNELSYQISYKRQDASIRLGLVNCVDQSYLCERWEIDGYPQLFKMDKKKMIKFPGRRVYSDLEKFVGYHTLNTLDVPMERGFYKWLYYGNRHHLLFTFIGLTVVLGAILWEWWYFEEKGEEYTQIKEE